MFFDKGLIKLVIIFMVFISPSYATDLMEHVTKWSNSIGNSQNVAIVLCKYKDLEAPIRDSNGDLIDSPEAIARLLSTEVNDYYSQATRRITASGGSYVSFNFIPVSGICQLSFPDNGNIGDKNTLKNEVGEAIKYVVSTSPNLFDSTDRILVVVNGKKRARASAPMPEMIPEYGFKIISKSIVDIDDMAEKGLSVVSHELGHQLGLLDLYAENPDPGYVGQWAQMASDRGQNFSAYSRYVARWIDKRNRVITIVPPLPGTSFEREIEIGLPNNENGLPELVRLDVSGATNSFPQVSPFNGYLLEARNPDEDSSLDNNIDKGYRAGLLVYRHLGIINSYINKEQSGDPNPRPLELCKNTFEDCGTLSVNNLGKSSLIEGDTFTDSTAGLAITVINEIPNGGQKVRVTWKPTPKPDIAIKSVRLDNLINGSRIYQQPRTYGDPISYTVSLNWSDTVIPYPLLPTVVVARGHTVNITLANEGFGNLTRDLKGTLYISKPFIPAGSMNSLDKVRGMAFDSFPFSIPKENLPAVDVSSPNVTTRHNLRIPITPPGPFIAWVMIESQNELEHTMGNNFYVAPFIIFQLRSGSPFEPLDLELPVKNINRDDNIFALSVTGLSPFPEKWKVKKLENQNITLESNQSKTFKMYVHPPTPDEILKPSWSDKVDVTAWMAYRDSFIPIFKLPVYYSLTEGTKLTLDEIDDGKPIVRGRLERIKDGNEVGGLSKQPVELVISSSTGDNQTTIVETDTDGKFAFKFNETPSGCQAIIARYAGDTRYGASQSDTRRYFYSACKRKNVEEISIKELSVTPQKDRTGNINHLISIKLSRNAPSDIEVNIHGTLINSTKKLTLVVPQGKNSIESKIKISHSGTLIAQYYKSKKEVFINIPRR